MSTGTPKRRWYQFSIRTLLVVMLVSLVVFGFVWQVWKNRSLYEQKQKQVWSFNIAVAEIHSMGGSVKSNRKVSFRNYDHDACDPRRITIDEYDYLLDERFGRGALSFSVTFAYGTSGSQKITGVGLERLQDLPNLEHLDLRATNVTDDGLECINQIMSLKRLFLDNTKVSDAGLVHLNGLTDLQVLRLMDTKVSENGIKKLKQALPNCVIEH
jgi:hypothetical protein